MLMAEYPVSFWLAPIYVGISSIAPVLRLLRNLRPSRSGEAFMGMAMAIDATALWQRLLECCRRSSVDNAKRSCSLTLGTYRALRRIPKRSRFQIGFRSPSTTVTLFMSIGMQPSWSRSPGPEPGIQVRRYRQPRRHLLLLSKSTPEASYGGLAS
jgi:hypothetical protein